MCVRSEKKYMIPIENGNETIEGEIPEADTEQIVPDVLIVDNPLLDSDTDSIDNKELNKFEKSSSLRAAFFEVYYVLSKLLIDYAFTLREESTDNHYYCEDCQISNYCDSM